MSYVDLNTIHNPATGTVAPAAWGDQVRDNDEFLIDPPVCSVKATVAQSIATGTTTVLVAGTEVFDNDGMHSTVSNTSRITIQTDGRYLVLATVRFIANATGVRFAEFRRNGATLDTIATSVGIGTLETVISGSRAFVLTAGEYVEVVAHQSSGGNLDVGLMDFTAVFLTR